VIEVRVRQHHSVNSRGVERERRPIAQPQFFEALKQAAIHEHATVAEIEEMLGAGHRAGRAEKRQ
jgi:hypothetical protein